MKKKIKNSNLLANLAKSWENLFAGMSSKVVASLLTLFIAIFFGLWVGGESSCYAAQGMEAVNGNLGQGVASLLPFALIMLVVYFMMIRPQHKKMKEHQNMLKTLKKGDKVLVSGISGSVHKIDESANFIELEIAKDVVVKVRRDAINELLSAEQS